MRPELQKVEARIMPFRKAVTKAYIMLSPVAAVRDVIGGLRSNIVRSLTKYRTDIDAKDVMWAYQYVLRHGSMSTMTIDLLDKFNTKYLISNIGLAQRPSLIPLSKKCLNNLFSSVPNASLKSLYFEE